MSEEQTQIKQRTYKKSTIITVGSQKPKADKVRHYVDNVAFYDALVKRKEEIELALASNLPPPRISEFVGECVLKIARKLSSLHYFSGKYSYVDEMVDRAVENCIRKIDKFDVNETKNPFSYFTQICYYSFISTIENEKDHSYIKLRCLIDALSNPDMVRDLGEETGEGDHSHDNMTFDLGESEKFVSAYEKKKNIRHGEKKVKKTKRSAVEDLFSETQEEDTEITDKPELKEVIAELDITPDQWVEPEKNIIDSFSDEIPMDIPEHDEE